MNRFVLGLAVLALLAGHRVAQCAPLTPGNILVSNSTNSRDGALFEYTSAGALVQSVSLPLSGESFACPRSVVVDSAGNAQIFNGSFTPLLTTYHADTGTITNATIPGWTTIGNFSYGGLAAYGNYLYATSIGVGDGQSGLLRINTRDMSTTWFGNDSVARTLRGSGFMDVAIGFDGLLYALCGLGTEGDKVIVYDPTTLAQKRWIGLPVGIRSLAVSASGDIYGAQWGGPSHVYHFGTNGELLGSVADTFSIGGFQSIDLDRQGRLVVGSSWGPVLMTDTSLSALTHFDTRFGVTGYVTFVQSPVPEPSTLVLLATGSVGLFIWRKWRVRRSSRGSA